MTNHNVIDYVHNSRAFCAFNKRAKNETSNDSWGDKQGGGALSDMMCHSVEVARHLLTDPEKPRESLKVKSANGTVSTLKWSRPEYANELTQTYGPGVDYLNRPSEDSEQGLMPVVEDEAGLYGYTDENRHMVEAFRKGELPAETFHDGLAVVEILMALYMSAAKQATVHFPCADLEDYVPVVARDASPDD